MILRHFWLILASFFNILTHFFQRTIRQQMTNKKDVGEASKNYFPVGLYSAPYFHDSNGMIPELNEEAKEIIRTTKVDLSFREPAFWKEEDENLIISGVRESIINNRTIDLEAR